MNEAAQDEALTRIDLTDLWGVAGRLAARLKAIGIASPLDLKRGDRRLIHERLAVLAPVLGARAANVRLDPVAADRLDRHPSSRRRGVPRA